MSCILRDEQRTRAETGLGEGGPANRTSNSRGIKLGRGTVSVESIKRVLWLNYKVLDIHLKEMEVENTPVSLMLGP